MIGQVYFSLHYSLLSGFSAKPGSPMGTLMVSRSSELWDKVRLACCSQMQQPKKCSSTKFSRRSTHLIKESETELETFFQFCARIRILQHHLTIFNMSKWLWLFDSVCGSYIQLNHHEGVKLFLQIGQLTMSQLWYVDQQRQAQKALKSYGEALHQLANRKQERGLCFFLFGWVKPILTSSCCCCGFKLLRVGTRFWDFRFSQVDKTSFEGFAFVSWWEIHGKCCHVWCFRYGQKRVKDPSKLKALDEWFFKAEPKKDKVSQWHKSIDESSMPTTANALMYALLYVRFFLISWMLVKSRNFGLQWPKSA